MSKVTKPILLDETGKEIINALNVIANAIGESDDYALEQQATGIVLEESSNPAWTRLGNKSAIDRVINEYPSIVIDPVHKKYAILSREDDLVFEDGTAWDGTYGEALRHFPDLHYLVKTNDDGKQVLWGSHHNINGHTFHENFVGVYKGSIGADGKLHSRPNVRCVGDRTMSQFWDLAQLHGHEWGLMNYHDHQKMIAMYALHYGDMDSQKIIGDGLIGGYDAEYYNCELGATHALGIHSGNAPYKETAYKQVKLFGVEGLWGSQWEFRPGIRFEGVKAIAYEGNIVSNTALGREFERDAALNFNGTYFKNMALGERFDVIPTASGASSSTYYCDGAWSSAGGQLLLVGGYSYLGSVCGLTASYSNSGFSYSYADIGARLSFRGSLDEFELVSGQELAATSVVTA